MIAPLTPPMELAALQHRIDELQRQCDQDGAELRAQLRAVGRPITGTEASTTELGRRLVDNRILLAQLGQQLTAAQGRARRHNSATRS